jgi:transcriptional regulator with XRE-family HTH domain
MKLASYLAKTDQTETAFAQALGVSQVTINRYVRNERFPDPEMIERIDNATEHTVTVTDWYQQAAEHRASKEAEKAA